MDITVKPSERGDQQRPGEYSADTKRGSVATVAAARAVLAGDRRFSLKRALPFLGPAFIAAVAYIDPGNFATNIQAGSQFGYLLLWVILASNLMAVLLQTLSAKLGIATGRNLPELCRRHLPRPVSMGLWVVAEIGAMATDLAEFLGAAVGFNLLLHVPLFLAGLLTAVATFGILALQRFGFRPLEALITVLVGVIAGAYLIELFIAKPHGGQIAYHLFVPGLAGPESVLLAVGILGATVMPHVVYLHSALTQNRVRPRNAGEARAIFRFERFDIWLAMGLAGIVNGAMLIMAASVFFSSGHTGVSSIETAFQTLTPLAGNGAAALFGVALLASGLSSSAVGTLAGQVIMEGFTGWRIPLWIRRAITMLPALVVIALGMDPTRTLVLSQVALSFVLPFAIIPLLYFTGRRDIMRGLVNHRVTRILGWGVAAIIIALNLVLLYSTFTGL
ncbi:MAG: Manganese transport protein MntH [Ktedonobacterales bacterium]|jgi:manganese transport protein|nr:MAG: Manganese transport protein MntH [Ktedonobacterales bacterium]